jgi:hypothetical protein
MRVLCDLCGCVGSFLETCVVLQRERDDDEI